MNLYAAILMFFINSVACRDFYVGMFKKNDILVAQDRLYKERVPFRSQFAKYGRYFKCPITYFRVVDRLGARQGPKVNVIRGGLRHKYIVLRLTAYNLPISVNVYVGCENKMTTTKVTKNTKVALGTTHADTTADGDVTTDTSAAPAGDTTTDAAGVSDTTTDAAGVSDTTTGVPGASDTTTEPPTTT